jgi:Zn-dependent protease with chaperone function
VIKLKNIVRIGLFFCFLSNCSLLAINEIVEKTLVSDKSVDQELITQLNRSNDVVGFTRVTETNLPKLYNIVKKLTTKVGNPMPLIFVFKGNLLSSGLNELGYDYTCNVYALSLTKSTSLICVGRDLVDNLTESELEAVVAHELGHIDKYHVIKGLIWIWVLIFTFKYLVKFFPATNRVWYHFVPECLDPYVSEYLAQFLESFTVAYIAKKLIKNFVFRCQEKEADLFAASIIDDPNALGQALECMDKVYTQKDRVVLDGLMRLFRTHPLRKDRVAYLKALAAKQS